MHMVEARRRTQWEPLSLFMSLFANSKRNPKKKAFKISDFFPFEMEPAKSDYERLPKAEISDLKFILKNGV